MEIDRDLIERLFQRYLILRAASFSRSADEQDDDPAWERLAVDQRWTDAELIEKIGQIINQAD